MLWRKKSAGPGFGHVSFEDDRDIDVRRLDDQARKHFWSEARLLVRDLVFALLVAALFVVFVMQPVKVEGTSMLPRLHDGERIFVNKLVYYHLPRLQRGDIVVFWYPDDPDKSYIKRVIALPGELLEIRDGVIYINGQELKEPYIEAARNVTRVNHAPVLVKPHYYFVMGDNRDQSYDSRSWGLVPEKYIYGKALLRYWPLAQASVIRHETDYDIASRRRAPGQQTPDPDGEEVEP